VRLACLALAVVILAGCGRAEEEAPTTAVTDPGLVHVHGIGRNPADGALMVATHAGLFRVVPEEGSPKRVAGLYQDTMGFTVVGPDHFLGSGHPGRAGDPAFLGLIESRDAGRSWKPISLRGDVDFHVLEAQGETVYGFGSDWRSREARFLRSTDSGRTWTRLDPPGMLMGLAIDPTDAARIVALGERDGYVSTDGGENWRPIDAPGGLVTWTSELGVVAVDADGVVRQADAPTGDWEEVGKLGGPPAALEGVGEELLAATHDPALLSSRDGGSTWSDLLAG
jgi:photosystem II stability/assembly factor-like uncharacterized protein